VIVGVNPTETRLELPVYRFHRRNLTLRGSYGVQSADDFRSAVAWLSRLDLVSLVSHRFSLPEIERAFRRRVSDGASGAGRTRDLDIVTDATKKRESFDQTWLGERPSPLGRQRRRHGARQPTH
jgi:hypothetical protein